MNFQPVVDTVQNRISFSYTSKRIRSYYSAITKINFLKLIISNVFHLFLLEHDYSSANQFLETDLKYCKATACYRKGIF